MAEGVRDIEKFIEYIKEMHKTSAVWNIDTVFGVTTEEIQNRLQEIKTAKGEISWDQVAVMLRDEFHLSEFQVGFAVGSLFMSMVKLNMIQQMNKAPAPTLGGS